MHAKPSFVDIKRRLKLAGGTGVAGLLIFALIYFAVPALGFGAGGIAAGMPPIISEFRSSVVLMCEPRELR